MSFFEPKTPKNQGLPAFKSRQKSFAQRESERGNGLILVFIMIALFAALNYAISQGTRGGAAQIADDRAELLAIELMQYAQEVKNAVQQLQINGCDVFGGISLYSAQFANPSFYNMSTAPSDKSCHIFDPNGGNITWQDPPKEIQDIGGTEYLYTGKISIKGIGTDDNEYSTGKDKAMELALISFVSQKICAKINEKMNINSIGQTALTVSIPPANWEAYGDFNASRGGFIYSSVIGNSTQVPQVFGKMTGCYYSTSNEHYYFYQVLAAR